jgi:hypothetical protein
VVAAAVLVQLELQRRVVLVRAAQYFLRFLEQEILHQQLF